MNIGDLKDKWIVFVNKMNKYGIPVPTVRDPRTGKGSITTALVVFSAGLFGLCILFLLATAGAKTAGWFILTDATMAQVKMAADYSFQFLMAALGGYLGRHLQKGEAIDESNPPSQKGPQDAKSKASQKVDSPD